MPKPRLDDADRQRGGVAEFSNRPDFDLALVVGSSAVNRVVIARIAARVGLKVIAIAPEEAQSTLSKRPGVVILDGGADDRDCEGLIESLAAQRLAAGGSAPFVILLQNAKSRHEQPMRGGTIDAVVAKPISPDRLEPLIRSMIDRVRD